MDAATDFSVFVRRPSEGVAAMDLVVDGVWCGACIVTIEKGLAHEPGVRGARVNLASKRVTVEWDEGALTPAQILDKLDSLGYPAYPFSSPVADSLEAAEERPPAALPRRRRLRRHERDAALRRSVGGRGQRRQQRDARSVPLVLGAGRDSQRRLCGRAVLRERVPRASPALRSTWTCRSPSASCCRC